MAVAAPAGSSPSARARKAHRYERPGFSSESQAPLGTRNSATVAASCARTLPVRHDGSQPGRPSRCSALRSLVRRDRLR
eukprot:8637056-Lingulodinium_polyedra.AAC.1